MPLREGSLPEGLSCAAYDTFLPGRGTMSNTAAHVRIPWTQRICSFFAEMMRKLLVAFLVGGLLGGLVAYFADELQAFTESLIFNDKLNGEYVLPLCTTTKIKLAAVRNDVQSPPRWHARL
jgi:hypothetical protein